MKNRDMGHSATILCLDDEPVGLEVRKTILEQSGYRVITATSAEAAFDTVAAEHIDLVITDHCMDGTLGTQLAAALKKTNPRLPILILSGLTELPEEDSARADAFLCKLEPPPVLLETVAQLLRRCA